MRRGAGDSAGATAQAGPVYVWSRGGVLRECGAGRAAADGAGVVMAYRDEIARSAASRWRCGWDGGG